MTPDGTEPGSSADSRVAKMLSVYLRFKVAKKDLPVCTEHGVSTLMLFVRYVHTYIHWQFLRNANLQQPQSGGGS